MPVGKTSPGDHDLNPDFTLAPPPRPLADAAVLIPILPTDPPKVLLTHRTPHLKSHAGQIAFPGGKVDPGETVPQTAIREAHEEVGLETEFVEIVGYLDGYRTRTGYAVSPAVALIRPGYKLVPNPAEVARVFEVPLAFIAEAENLRKETRIWQGKQRFFYAIPYEEHYIWGATAGIIRNFHERLKRA